MSSELYFLNDLSLKRAEEIVIPEFIPAYNWFIDNAGTIGPRPWRDNKPKNMPITMVAQAGIHKPTGQQYALSITSTGYEGYADQAVQDQGDNTWLFRYSEHTPTYGDKGKVQYNKSLMECLEDGIPVGVFVKERGSDYLCLGLAFVEEYDEDTGEFVLHGPVNHNQSSDFWSIVKTDELRQIEQEYPDEFDDLVSDERTIRAKEFVQRIGQQMFREGLIKAYDSTCAMSAYDVPKALQAAHISSYRGPKSQKTSNGLLLRADLHLLYDSHLISIRPDSMQIEIANEIGDSHYSDLDGRQIKIPKNKDDRPAEKRLETHYQRFKERAAS